MSGTGSMGQPLGAPNLVEINFDGIVGPTHNYAGLSLGNIASALHQGEASYPRAAALQGLDKMRANMELGLAQGYLLPLPRPNLALAQSLGLDESADPALIAAPWSASSMWTANAATVSPAPDTHDGKCHLTVANLSTMVHRAQEWPDTLKQLQIAFADKAHFEVHGPVPSSFGDEGAANHMRLCHAHGEQGLELFVYGVSAGPFPARQHEQASRAIARLHGLSPDNTMFIEQNRDAIAAGAFHNDVVAVANGTVLFAHEQAFANAPATYEAIRAKFPALELVEVPASAVSLELAIKTYLFNAQLVSLPTGKMALVVPMECRESVDVWQWCEQMAASNGPISRVIPVDVRQSMANGGGPACLRLRVVADPATVDPRFILSPATADAIHKVIAEYWPEQIDPGDLTLAGLTGSSALADTVRRARESLLGTVDLPELG